MYRSSRGRPRLETAPASGICRICLLRCASVDIREGACRALLKARHCSRRSTDVTGRLCLINELSPVLESRLIIIRLDPGLAFTRSERDRRRGKQSEPYRSTARSFVPLRSSRSPIACGGRARDSCVTSGTRPISAAIDGSFWRATRRRDQARPWRAGGCDRGGAGAGLSVGENARGLSISRGRHRRRWERNISGARRWFSKLRCRAKSVLRRLSPCALSSGSPTPGLVRHGRAGHQRAISLSYSRRSAYVPL